jgi:hypothetical protein
MTDQNPSGKQVREIVALFTDRPTFDKAVTALLRAGFDRNDLSVLATHESLDAAGRPGRPYDEALTGLVGELNYAFPLATAGLIAIVGGPITAPLAALVAAGISGVAIKEYLDEVTAHPHTEQFAAALEAGGVVLWVNVGQDAARETLAVKTLEATGSRNVHPAERTEGGTVIQE